MAKKLKLKTPNWILEGEKKPIEKSNEKTFKIRRCPECNSDDVGVVIGKNNAWECHKCGWKGENIKEEELTEEEFMKYSDSKGEEVS